MTTLEPNELEAIYWRLGELAVELRELRDSGLLGWDEALHANRLYRELGTINRILYRICPMAADSGAISACAR